MPNEDIDFSKDWVSHTKLLPAPVPSSVIDRKQVERLLDSAMPVVILEAPAGYGKTTLLTQAHSLTLAAGHKAAWISIDKNDGDSREFLKALVIAIENQGLDLSTLHHLLAPGFAGNSPRNIAVALASAVAASGIPLVIFIDDLHLADSSTITSMLETLIANMRVTCRFVIATRWQLDLALVKMQAAGIVDVLTRSDLRLNSDEGRKLLQGHAALADIDMIFERVEGWPVMLQLARLSLKRQPTGQAGLSTFSGQTSELAAYLAEQVTSGLSDDLQQVLMAMAVCERFNGDLVNHLCHRDDGWRVLEDFVRQGLLVIPLDIDGRWYRYHALFGEFLLGRLERREFGASRRLGQKAAEWFAANGMLATALRQASACDDMALTVKILNDAGGWLVAFRGGTEVLRIIGALPETVLRQHPFLRLGQIYVLAQDSRLQQAQLLFNELLNRTTNCNFLTPEEEQLFQISATVLAAVLKVYSMERIEPEQLLTIAQRNHVPLPPALEAMITHLIGYCRFYDGDLNEARYTVYAAADQSRLAGANYIETYSYLLLGETHLELGELTAAENSFKQAIDRASSSFGADCNQIVAGRVFLSELAYERNDFDTAEALMRSVITTIEQKDPWFSVYRSAYHVISEIILYRKGWQAAIEVLNEAGERLRAHNLNIYIPYLSLKRAEILTAAGNFEQATEELRTCLARHGEIGSHGNRHRLLERIAEARLFLVSGHLNEAFDALESLLPPLAERRHVRRMIKVKTLLAAAYHQHGEPERAVELLRSALNAATPEGLIGPIFEERDILRPMLQQSYAEQVINEFGEFATILLTEISRPDGAIVIRPSLLSHREEQILQMLANGLSGKEMATRTDLSVSTVHSYRKNLYRKLKVSSRSGAIIRGRETGYIR